MGRIEKDSNYEFPSSWERNPESMIWNEWRIAACIVGPGTCEQVAAWRAGEDPTEWRAANPKPVASREDAEKLVRYLMVKGADLMANHYGRKTHDNIREVGRARGLWETADLIRNIILDESILVSFVGWNKVTVSDIEKSEKALRDNFSNEKAETLEYYEGKLESHDSLG